MSKFEFRTVEFRISEQQRSEVLERLKKTSLSAFRSQLLHDQIFVGESQSADCFRVRLNRTYWKAMLQRVKVDGRESKLKSVEIAPSEIHLVTTKFINPKWSGSWFKKQIDKNRLRLAYEVVFERSALVTPRKITHASPGVVNSHSSDNEMECSLSIDRITKLITREAAPASVSAEFNLKFRFKDCLPGLYKRIIYDLQLRQASCPFVNWQHSETIPVRQPLQETNQVEESVCLIG